MLVVYVGRVRVCVHESCVPMLMYVRFACRIFRPMRMLMVFVVRVGVQMSCWIMAVNVLVAL